MPRSVGFQMYDLPGWDEHPEWWPTDRPDLIPPVPKRLAEALNQHSHDWLALEADTRDILVRERLRYGESA